MFLFAEAKIASTLKCFYSQLFRLYILPEKLTKPVSFIIMVSYKFLNLHSSEILSCDTTSKKKSLKINV